MSSCINYPNCKCSLLHGCFNVEVRRGVGLSTRFSLLLFTLDTDDDDSKDNDKEEGPSGCWTHNPPQHKAPGTSVVSFR